MIDLQIIFCEVIFVCPLITVLIVITRMDAIILAWEFKYILVSNMYFYAICSC